MSVPDPPHALAARSPRAHPRRTAPEHSVSLRRPPVPDADSDDSGKPSNGDVSAASRVAAHGGRPSPPAKKDAEVRNAEKWFDDSNQNTGGRTNVRFIDDDPPFYLPKHRSSEGDGSRGIISTSQSGNLVTPAAVDSNGSSREDYRSVIDDLTVENQELKRKLRKYQALHSAHMQDDKLFELRVYKLSQSRRRRLEGMLREFVSNIGRSPPESMSSGTIPPVTAPLPLPISAFAHTKRSASSTSNKPVDSAYASMSASGAASVSQTHNAAEPQRPIRPAPESSSAYSRSRPAAERAGAPKDQRVQSYLQTISRRLLPKYPPVMTEKTKKRLVVKRLEQLFVGRTDSGSKHSQSQQQQEVSQSAANADRRETEALGHHVQAEGRREAKMLRAPNAGASHPEQGNAAAANSTAGTPDQRPTRPLDLDPSRAQNPAETISYMKHLGFDSPRMDPYRPPAEEEGWVFLNLLINMAQLHTLNVTPGFVRNAIRDYSTNFELSEDRQNIRWKGGTRVSKMSSDSSYNSDESNDSVPEAASAARAASHTQHKAGDARVPTHAMRPVRNWPGPRAGDQFYSPIFYNPEEATSGSPTQEGLSSNSLPQTEDRSGGLSGESTSLENTKTSSRIAADGETGNLIFYRHARFCTDLKGDPTFPPSNAVYEKKTAAVLGVARRSHVSDAPSETKGPLSAPDPTQYIAAPPSADHDIGEMMDFPAPLPSSKALSKSSPPATLSASGVGGVTPADNFCIDIHHAYPPSGKPEVVDAKRRQLAPTPLPPPSYAFLPYSSASSDTEDSDQEEEADDASVGHFAKELHERDFIPPNFLGEFSSMSSQQRSHATSDGSSLDMLEFARKADPDRVAAQEREYESHARPDVAPPGSVAATIGDRSTFLTSQEDNASVDERHLRMMHERKASSLKRGRSDVDGSQRANKHSRVESQGS